MQLGAFATCSVVLFTQPLAQSLSHSPDLSAEPRRHCREAVKPMTLSQNPSASAGRLTFFSLITLHQPCHPYHPPKAWSQSPSRPHLLQNLNPNPKRSKPTLPPRRHLYCLFPLIFSSKLPTLFWTTSWLGKLGFRTVTTAIPMSSTHFERTILMKR